MEKVLKFTAKLKESTKQVDAIITKEMDKALRSAISRARPKIIIQIKELFREAIESSPEYESLMSGKLREEFGIEDAGRKLAEIMKIWLNNIDTEYNKNNSILTINICLSNFQDVLGLDAATVTTEKGGDLHWLEWLLLEGDKTVVKDFHIAYKPQNSRTDSYIMVEGGSWRVPPEFSGSMDDNFVTRALEAISDETVANIVRTQLTAAYR